MDIQRYPIHQFSIHQAPDGSFEVVREYYDEEAGLETRYKVASGLTHEQAEAILQQIAHGSYITPGSDDYEE